VPDRGRLTITLIVSDDRPRAAETEAVTYAEPRATPGTGRSVLVRDGGEVRVDHHLLSGLEMGAMIP
jgi:hypothetical protein